MPDGADRRRVAWAILADLLPAAATLSNPCARCGGPHGGVRVAGAPYVASVSYAGGFCVVAAAPCTDAAALGVDAEVIAGRDGRERRFADLLAPGHVASARDWTRIEAALKADGRGLRIEPASVVVRMPEAEASVTVDLAADGGDPPQWRADVPGGGMFDGWDAEGPPGVAVSVARRRPRGAAAREAPARRATR